MRLYYDGFVRHVASMGAPGIDETRWIRPVRPGDRLSLLVTVADKRASASRPDRGFVGVALDLRNGADETVMTQRFSMIVQRRDAVAPAAAGPAVPIRTHDDLGVPDADPVLGAFYEDVPVGHAVALGTQLFTPDAIVGFATAFDPQYFHVDAERAKASHFGGLVASGFQIGAYWMKHYIAARQRAALLREASGLVAAPSGPSPGYTNLKWIKPAHAGATVAFALRIVGKRPMPGRQGWGMVMTENTGHDADGTLIFSFDGRPDVAHGTDVATLRRSGACDQREAPPAFEGVVSALPVIALGRTLGWFGAPSGPSCPSAMVRPPLMAFCAPLPPALPPPPAARARDVAPTASTTRRICNVTRLMVIS